MPGTVNANKLSITHASSTGVSTIFPDVCKTPTPGGPIPIPYPNIAQSSDTGDGSSTLKADGNPIMLKTSNYKMSTGDEAGSAMGVVSNKIKGKAEPLNYSFDVKVDGKNVFRLTDMTLQNCGSSANTPPAVNVEPPVVGMDPKLPECEKTEEKWKEQQAAATAWGESGIIGAHHGPIQAAADTHKSVMYFRKTKAICGKWISTKHQPKPHSCMAGTTITGDVVDQVTTWINRLLREEGVGAERPVANLAHDGNPAHRRTYVRNGAAYVGIIGLQVRAGEIQPLIGTGSGVVSYEGKWMTGDYDLFEVLKGDEPCVKVKGDDFAKLQEDVNKGCSWDAIQHGPQAQWVPEEWEQKEGVGDFDWNELVAQTLMGNMPLEAKVKWHPQRNPMPIIDEPLTIVAGKGVMFVDRQGAVDAMKCQECPK